MNLTMKTPLKTLKTEVKRVRINPAYHAYRPSLWPVHSYRHTVWHIMGISGTLTAPNSAGSQATSMNTSSILCNSILWISWNCLIMITVHYHICDVLIANVAIFGVLRLDDVLACHPSLSAWTYNSYVNQHDHTHIHHSFTEQSSVHASHHYPHVCDAHTYIGLKTLNNKCFES
jgi:hypothetical protein